MSATVHDSAYKDLFDANPHPMWVFEREGLRFMAVNDAALLAYGYTRAEFLSMTILDIRPLGDDERVRQNVDLAGDTQDVWLHRRRDGSIFRAEVTGRPLEFLGIPARLVSAVDVNARERSAELLRRSVKTLKTVVECAPVGMALVRPDGQMGECNEEARRLLGGTCLGPIEPLVQAALEGRLCEAREMELAPGRWAEVSARPTENGAVVVLADATLRRAERLDHSREKETLETAVRTSDEELEGFCFSVSHDLRGPLRAVDGFSQMVLSDPEANLSDDNRDALQRVRKAAHRMGELIDGLLVLSRLSRAPMEPTWLDLTEIVRRSASDLQRLNPERSMRFEIDPGLNAYGDPKLVAMLVESLIGNAVKFTAKKPEAWIGFKAQEDGWVVQDNGAGFDMAYASGLFKPFERLHGASEFPGNGLGLAVAQRVVRRHGGRLTAWGKVNEGATFAFSLSQP